ncbi:reverse transcriptase domain-containing protein [Tanacetum coccineum]
MNQEKQKEKDDVQIHKFWQMFKQLHINITLADALILIPKYQKMLKSLLSNKEKLIELANTPVIENCSAHQLDATLGVEELGLPELISTQMTLELANRDICTPKGIARDVFVPVGKFTFPADFVIVDYESDPRVPLILGRPFLRTARALIDVHGEEMILRDGNERLILNMRNDTSSYSNEPHQESINMIDVYNVSHEEYRKDLFATNHPSGNPTSSLTSYPDLTLPEVNDDIFDPEEDIIENLLNLDKTKDLPPYHDNQLNDYDDNLFDLETVNDNPYDDPFDSKEEKIKELKLLIDEVDLLRSSDFLPFPECDLVFYVDFSEVDALPSTNNEDKVFNPGILIHENLFEVTNYATPEKNVKKATNASLILEDLDPPLSLYELPFHKEVPVLGALLSFSSKN